MLEREERGGGEKCAKIVFSLGRRGKVVSEGGGKSAVLVNFLGASTAEEGEEKEGEKERRSCRTSTDTFPNKAQRKGKPTFPTGPVLDCGKGKKEGRKKPPLLVRARLSKKRGKLDVRPPFGKKERKEGTSLPAREYGRIGGRGQGFQDK